MRFLFLRKPSYDQQSYSLVGRMTRRVAHIMNSPHYRLTGSSKESRATMIDTSDTTAHHCVKKCLAARKLHIMGQTLVTRRRESSPQCIPLAFQNNPYKKRNHPLRSRPNDRHDVGCSEVRVIIIVSAIICRA